LRPHRRVEVKAGDVATIPLGHDAEGSGPKPVSWLASARLVTRKDERKKTFDQN
jgi:hypothetical protein